MKTADILTVACMALLVLVMVTLGIHSKRDKENGIVHCRGYTVLDSSRIILCNNDTITYNWRKYDKSIHN
jgi:hypothetical protein